VTPYSGSFRSFGFSYPPGWFVRDNEDSVSLWKSDKGGAITISAVRNKDPNARGHARQQCDRFVAKHTCDEARIEGDQDSASGAFTDLDGLWCKVRFIASGPRMVFATYNASLPDPVEEDEADLILASLRINSGSG
jgi:hypothetical protein